MSDESWLTPDAQPTPGVIVAVADPAVRTAFAAALAADGFEVWPTTSGLEALSTFLDHTGEVDAVLIGTGLHDLSASEFVRRLHAHFPGVPCVFVGDPGEAAGLRDCGERAITRLTGQAAVVAAIRNAIAAESRDERPSRPREESWSGS